MKLKDWYTFDGAHWAKLANNKSTIKSLGSHGQIDAAGISKVIFNKENLSKFKKAKVYIGYGVGPTLLSAWQQMLRSSDQFFECARDPSS